MTAAADGVLVRRAYDAFDSRDIHGRDGVREHWPEQFAAVDPRLELLGIESLGDGRLRAAVRQVVRRRRAGPSFRSRAPV